MTQKSKTKKQNIDVKKLSDKQIVNLLVLLEKKRELDRKEKVAYRPHKGQLKVHSAESKERYLFCGNGFGKTAILVNEVHWAATGFNPISKKHTPLPAKICLLLDNPEKIEDFLTEYRKWNEIKPEQLFKRGKPNISQISYDNGSTVTILTHAVEPLRLEGSEWTHIMADEPPPKKVFTALFRGGRIKGRPLQVLLAGTPIMGSWLRREVWEPWSRGETNDIECFKGHSSENKVNQDPDWLDRFASKLSEDEKKIRLEGHFFDLSGQALADIFSRQTHVISRADLEWNQAHPCVVSIDPHPNKPHFASLLGIDDDDQFYYLKEMSLKVTPREFAHKLKEFYRDYRVVDIVCDSLGSQQYTGGDGFKSFIQVLIEEGIPVRPTTYDEKGDDNFITRIQDALVIPREPNSFGQRIPKLRILDDCHGIITDIENVQWLRDKRYEVNKPKLDITNTDYLATLKYGLAANLHFRKGRTRVYKPTKMPSSYGIQSKSKFEVLHNKLSIGLRRYRKRMY